MQEVHLNHDQIKEKALIFKWGGKMSEVIQDCAKKTKDNVSTEYGLVHFLHYV